MKQEAINWLKVIGLFFLRSFTSYVVLDSVALIIIMFQRYILFVKTNEIFSRSIISSMCLVLSVYMAAKTKYYLGDKIYVLWSGEYDFFKSDKNNLNNKKNG